MSSVFLSHSSADNERALAIKRALESRGHTVFLDLTGIGGGADWERTLYERLHVCQAVVALISPDWLASKWCFAEVVHARATGKLIVPVKIRAYDEARVLGQLQEIDLTLNEENGLDRLRGALEDVHALVEGRSPYPGLAAFTEDDAAVFCGREPEKIAGHQVLESLRRRGRSAPRLLLVLGASGSGKSSLVRAGLLPKLRQHRSEWLVLPVVRPRASAVDELAVAWAAAFAVAGEPREWSTIATALRGAGARVDARPVLLDLVRDLRIAARQGDATVLLVIDQAEELFGAAGSAEAATCLTLLRGALDRVDTELIVIATMRSDFLSSFQQHPFLAERNGRSLAYEQFTVDPMPASRIPEVIRGPASRVGLLVDDGLIDRLNADIPAAMSRDGETAATGGTREPRTADALPLLAFVLRRLWAAEQAHPDKRLDLQDYTAAGELKGAIENAAKDALGAEPPATSEQLSALRAAFVPSMVQVTSEGVLTRRRALLSEMPAASLPLLDRLADARLLVKDRDTDGQPTIEVAHEAVLRTWSLLKKWLGEDQYTLQIIGGLRRAAEEWRAATTDEARADLLVHRDGRLAEVRAVLTPRAGGGSTLRLDDASAGYLDACVRAQAQRDADARAEQDRRVNDARTIWRRTAIGIAIAAVLVVAVLLLSGVLVRTQARAQDRQLLALARLWLPQDPAIAGLILGEVRAPGELPALDLGAAALAVLRHPVPVELRHGGPVRWVDVSSDGQSVATASADVARVWSTDGSGSPRDLQHGQDVLRVLFSPGGKTLATSALDGAVRLWNMADGGRVADLDHRGQAVVALAFSSGGDRLLTGAFDGRVRVWSTAAPARLLFEDSVGSGTPVGTVAFDADAGWMLAASGESGKLRVWKADGSDAGRPVVDCELGSAIVSAAFDPERKWVATVTKDGVLHRFAPENARGRAACGPPSPDASTADRIVSAAFSPSVVHLVTLQKDGIVTVWNGLTRGIPRAPVVRPAGARHVAFAPDGAHFVTVHDDGASYVWRIDQGQPTVTLARHGRAVRHAAFSRDGRLVVTASDDGTARLWRVGEDALTRAFAMTIIHPRNVSDVSFSRKGDQVLTSSLRGDVRLSEVGGAKVHEFSHPSAAAREASLSPNGDLVLSVGGDHRARVWRAAAKEQRGPPRVLLDGPGGTSAISRARFSADGRRIVTASEDGTARIWSTEDAAAPPILLLGHKPGTPLTVAAFDPAGSRVMTASHDGTARLWDAASGTALRVLDHGAGVPVHDAVFSRDGGRIATAGGDKAVRVWRNDGSAPVLLRHRDVVRLAAFSPDGQKVLTASDDGIARLWRADGEGRPIELIGHDPGESSIASAEFSEGGKLVLTASNDGTARVWSADGAGDPIVLRHPRALVRAAFSPSGDKVITGSSDSRATIWTIDPAALLEKIRARPRSCLTPEFRVRYFLEPRSEAERMFRGCESGRP